MIKSQKDHAVDMIVGMPETTLQRKDYLDQRYFYKRAYFLAVIASALLKRFKGAADLKLEYLTDNTLLPVLSLTPKAKGKRRAAQGQNSPRGYELYHVLRKTSSPQKLVPGAALIRKDTSDDAIDPRLPRRSIIPR